MYGYMNLRENELILSQNYYYS